MGLVDFFGVEVPGRPGSAPITGSLVYQGGSPTLYLACTSP